ncbi:MAG: transposase [Candidatus Brocadiaceae bacterium]|uniref:transposase n=1 Tax=Candidatus Wunengus sp. YC61 TaxID=3367698 RepID=UPI00272517BB|nr:transposase [Candidatus Brocadiaceae bacterium]
MENKDYRKQCATRAGVEATVSEMVRSHGVRKSRHRTESRTRLQLLFAAIACNVKRFIRHGILYGYVTSDAAKTMAASAFSITKWVLGRIYSPCLTMISLFSLKSALP